MQDYELTLTVRNAPMLNAMRAAGMKTASDVARASGVSQTTVGNMLALKITAYFIDREGKLRPKDSVQKVADALSVDPTDLYPESHILEPLERNKFRAQVSKQQMEQLAHQATQDPMAILIAMEEESARSIPSLCDRLGLSQRESHILREQIEAGRTLEDISGDLDISRARVQQIQASALRKMRSRVHTRKAVDELKELLHTAS